MKIHDGLGFLLSKLFGSDGLSIKICCLKIHGKFSKNVVPAVVQRIIVVERWESRRKQSISIQEALIERFGISTWILEDLYFTVRVIEYLVLVRVVESKSRSNGTSPHLFLAASILKLVGLLGKEGYVNAGYVCRYQSCASNQNALSEHWGFLDVTKEKCFMWKEWANLECSKLVKHDQHLFIVDKQWSFTRLAW
jgi:hypothetical protein